MRLSVVCARLMAATLACVAIGGWASLIQRSRSASSCRFLLAARPTSWRAWSGRR